MLTSPTHIGLSQEVVSYVGVVYTCSLYLLYPLYLLTQMLLSIPPLWSMTTLRLVLPQTLSLLVCLLHLQGRGVIDDGRSTRRLCITNPLLSLLLE